VSAEPTTATPAWLYPVPKEFWRWALWRRRGARPAERPAGLPPRIPQSWWNEYQRRGFRPIAPPPPVPSPVPIGIAGQPGGWVSWAIHSDGWPPSTFVERLQGWAKWVTLDATLDVNLRRFRDVQQALEPHGIDASLWGMIFHAEEAIERCRFAGAKRYIAQDEGHGQVEPGFRRIWREQAADIELELVASPWEGLPHPHVDPAGWEAWTRPWLDVVVHCESYIGSNPAGGAPGLQAAEAAHRGFQRRAFVLETNYEYGFELAHYDRAEIRRVAGRAFSLYLLERASPADLQIARELAR
jgi:hypothetical protein